MIVKAFLQMITSPSVCLGQQQFSSLVQSGTWTFCEQNPVCRQISVRKKDDCYHYYYYYSSVIGTYTDVLNMGDSWEGEWEICPVWMCLD